MNKPVDKMTFRLPKSVAKKFKIKVVQNEDTIQRVCEEAVQQYLKSK